jgi:hypothetical protein
MEPVYTAVEKKACYFCKHPYTISFGQNFRFCPSCTAIYAFMSAMTKCEHVKGAPILYRHPWNSEEITTPFIYVAPLDDEPYHCSICDSQVIQNP